MLSGSVSGGAAGQSSTQDNRTNMAAANQSAPVDGKLAMKVTELGPQATSTGIKKQLLEQGRQQHNNSVPLKFHD